jgi:anaerobic dimethyl sulfoxide reductase subunit B (iron-sulfur subunit)
MCYGMYHEDFDTMKNLIAKYGDLRQLEGMPSPDQTIPSAVFKPRAEKKSYIKCDAKKAIQLLIRRDPLPKRHDAPEELVNVPREIIGRGKLVLKPKSIKEAMETSRNDEG